MINGDNRAQSYCKWPVVSAVVVKKQSSIGIEMFLRKEESTFSALKWNGLLGIAGSIEYLILCFAFQENLSITQTGEMVNQIMTLKNCLQLS